YVFATRVSLKQPVILLRQPFDRLYTSTWETGGVGTVGLNNLSAVLEKVRSHLDKFCQDYLAENHEPSQDRWPDGGRARTSRQGRYGGWKGYLVHQLATTHCKTDWRKEWRVSRLWSH
ncbi:MAG: hypothetical protein AB1898_33045, partial [Acidobacteriota bacterium]